MSTNAVAGCRKNINASIVCIVASAWQASGRLVGLDLALSSCGLASLGRSDGRSAQMEIASDQLAMAATRSHTASHARTSHITVCSGELPIVHHTHAYLRDRGR